MPPAGGRQRSHSTAGRRGERWHLPKRRRVPRTGGFASSACRGETGMGRRGCVGGRREGTTRVPASMLRACPNLLQQPATFGSFAALSSLSALLDRHAGQWSHLAWAGVAAAASSASTSGSRVVAVSLGCAILPSLLPSSTRSTKQSVAAANKHDQCPCMRGQQGSKAGRFGLPARPVRTHAQTGPCTCTCTT